jgi:tRNA uridine 5-carboxymethylaminomethyl modification enzyme
MGGAAVSRKAGQKKTAEEILGMPHVTLKDVEDIMVAVDQERAESNDGGDDETASKSMSTFSPASVYDTVEASIKYQSYVKRQHKDMESWRKAQGVRIPPDFVYEHSVLPTLSKEELEKLSLHRPNTFAEASQISGITPQSLIYLYHHVRRRNKDRDGRSNVKATAEN